jgi:hypothetical protein
MRNLLTAVAARTFIGRAFGARLLATLAALTDFSRACAARLRTLTTNLPNRFAALRWRLRSSRLGRSADGILVVPLLGVALVLGVITATAAARGPSDGADSDLAPAHIGGDVSADVETETERHVITVRRPGKRNVVTVERTRRRVVRASGGVETVLEPVPGPTKTVTVRGPSHTVTEVQTETVTTVVTVTEDKKAD